jgi:hypothetical protein
MFVIPEPRDVTVNVFGAAIFGIHTRAITSAGASDEKIFVWRVPSPIVTMFEILEVLWYAWDVLAVDFIDNCHRGGSDISGFFVPLRL